MVATGMKGKVMFISRSLNSIANGRRNGHKPCTVYAHTEIV